jgi:hypothetical protein
MGVLDVRYSMREYKKPLVNAVNPALSSEVRDEFSERSEDLRRQMARYLEQVETRQSPSL